MLSGRKKSPGLWGYLGPYGIKESDAGGSAAHAEITTGLGIVFKRLTIRPTLSVAIGVEEGASNSAKLLLETSATTTTSGRATHSNSSRNQCSQSVEQDCYLHGDLA